MNQVIERYQAMRFQYGLDCCQFAAECVKAQIGLDLAAPFRYRTEAEAQALIERYGDLRGLIESVLGHPYEGAKEGDVALVETVDGRQAAGIVFSGRVVLRTDRGLTDWPLETAAVFWDVTCLK